MISSRIITNSERLYSLFIQNIIDFSIFAHMHTCSCSDFHPPPGLPLPSKLIWHTPHTPPGLVPPPPHPPQSIPHRFFVASPVKTGMHSKNLEFSLSCALGLHPYHPLHPPTTPSPGATICAHSCTLVHLLRNVAHLFVHLAHLQCPICAPSAHPCTPFCAPFPGLVTLIRLSSDLGPPSGYHGQPSPSATGHSTHSRPLYNQVQPLRPPCHPSAFPVGLHNPHSHSRIWSSQVTSRQSGTHFSSW